MQHRALQGLPFWVSSFLNLQKRANTFRMVFVKRPLFIACQLLWSAIFNHKNVRKGAL